MSGTESARRSDTFSGPDSLEALMLARLRSLLDGVLAETIRQAVREEIARQGSAQAAQDRREWLSQPAAAQVAGCSVSTIRAWQTSGRLSKGERGRVNAAELRALLAGQKPDPSGSVLDMKASRIAASLREGR